MQRHSRRARQARRLMDRWRRDEARVSNLVETQVSGRLVRVGSRLALLIPADVALHCGLREGDRVEAVLERRPREALGLLSDIATEPFDRKKEHLWPESF